MEKGIYFRAQNHYVYATELGDISIKEVSAVANNFIARIPIIRFFFLIVTMVLTFISSLFKGKQLMQGSSVVQNKLLYEVYSLLRIILISLMVYISMSLSTMMFLLTNFYWSSVTSNLSFVVIIGWLIIGRGEIRSYHGAEHKIIYSYQKQLPLTLEQVRKNPKENIRCGSSLVGWAILLIFINPFLAGFISWLVLAVVYELFRLISGLREGSKLSFIRYIFFYPGYLLQKITTKEPTDEQIRLGLTGFKSLLVAEGIVYGTC